jgi:hypothetical protein
VRCTDVVAPEDGYACGACPDGFNGDGQNCYDIDDCAVENSRLYAGAMATVRTPE